MIVLPKGSRYWEQHEQRLSIAAFLCPHKALAGFILPGTVKIMGLSNQGSKQVATHTSSLNYICS